MAFRLDRFRKDQRNGWCGLSRSVASPLTKGDRIVGADYLRAVMSVFVVLMHTAAGGYSLIFSKERYLDHVYTLSDFINFQLLLLAVPAFIFLSVFLYEWRGADRAALARRLKRLVVLFLFWPMAFILFNSGYHGLSALVPKTPGAFLFLVLTAGKTVYYFFPMLIVNLLAAHVVSRLRPRIQLLCFVLAVAALAVLPYITIATRFFHLSAGWNPLIYFPLSIGAVLFAQNLHLILAKKTLVAGVSLLFSLVFAVLEWRYMVSDVFFIGQAHAIPTYTRVSLVFSIIAIAALAFDPGLQSNRVIRFMATNALALYCLHLFFMPFARSLSVGVVEEEWASALVVSAMVIVFSYAAAIPLRRYFLKDSVIT